MQTSFKILRSSYHNLNPAEKITQVLLVDSGTSLTRDCKETPGVKSSGYSDAPFRLWASLLEGEDAAKGGEGE